MPTPSSYVLPDGPLVFDPAAVAAPSPEIDLLFITDRAAETDAESSLPYGEVRDTTMAFGSAHVRIVPEMSREELVAQSRMGRRTEEVQLEMGPVQELGRFPKEPYALTRSPSGDMYREPRDMEAYESAKRQLTDEIQLRLAASPKKEIVLYVHGFNETFETAAFTAAELSYFLGREQVCAFFTWPASSEGSFLISYTTTTEAADYAISHLKKAIRLLARTPGVERLHLLTHSRGAAVMLSAVHELMIEAIAAGVESVDEFHIDNLVLFSPDIDIGVAATNFPPMRQIRTSLLTGRRNVCLG